MAADVLIIPNEDSSILLCKSPTTLFVRVCADRQFESDILIRLSVFLGDSAGSNQSYSQCASKNYEISCQSVSGGSPFATNSASSWERSGKTAKESAASQSRYLRRTGVQSVRRILQIFTAWAR